MQRRLQTSIGVFLSPHDRIGHNPTHARDGDPEYAVALDTLCFDEASIGTHHSGTFELISSTEVFGEAALAGLVGPFRRAHPGLSLNGTAQS